MQAFIAYNFLFTSIYQIIFLLLLLFSYILSSQKSLYKMSEIILTVKGDGDNIKILSDTTFCGTVKNISFNNFPDRIVINNETKNFTGIFVNLTQEINFIKLQWDNPPTNCRLMFDRVYSVINFDFSNFDTSHVTDMRCMFCDSNIITSLDITNFNTSLVTNMRSMFNKCTSLITLDLSNFDTSIVTDFYHMFYESSSLLSLNVDNFILNSRSRIDNMFAKCTSLISLDLTSFDETKLINKIKGLFSNVNPNLILRINIDNISSIYDYYPNFRININSSCFLENHKLIKEKKDCIEKCTLDDLYKYEYNGLCFFKCPNGTFYSDDNITCLEKDGYKIKDSIMDSFLVKPLTIPQHFISTEIPANLVKSTILAKSLNKY